MGVSPTTQDSYKNYIYNHIIVDIGDLQLDQLTQKHLQDYYERLKLGGRLVRQNVFGDGVSDRMVRGCHAICRKALEKACAVGLIPINPAIGCKIPPKKAREMEILTREEIQRFIIQAAYDGYYELFLLEFATGMRRGEISNMIGHSSVATTLDIYSHITDEMLKNASRVIDRGIGKEINRPENEIEIAMKQEVTPPTKTDFTAYKGKIRKSGTGGIYKLNDHLYEGRYTPTNAYGKRESCNVYGKTYEECEAKLEEMIARKRAEIAAEKARLKEQASA